MNDAEFAKLIGEMTSKAAAFQKTGKSAEELMKFMRDIGCSQGLTMFILPSVLGCSMGEAKRLVFFSPTWADMRKSNEKLHATLEKVLQDDFKKAIK